MTCTYMQNNMQNNMLNNSAGCIFCILGILQYAKYALIWHLHILHIGLHFLSPYSAYCSAYCCIFCIFCIYVQNIRLFAGSIGFNVLHKPEKESRAAPELRPGLPASRASCTQHQAATSRDYHLRRGGMGDWARGRACFCSHGR